MSLPTKGRVLLETSVGDIEIELWAKETPKACRNFIALALEGYYDDVIFHRVVPEFLVQTGDRTGTGSGGESFYGEPFEDEIHPRLRFAHRGLVGMANSGKKDTNDSQACFEYELRIEERGHLLLGQIVRMNCTVNIHFLADVSGTPFSDFQDVLKIGQLELDGERPVYPPKIRNVKILDNPFTDIIPRITAAEKRAQRLAKEQAIREREEAVRRKNVKKNTKLLSFGQDADRDEKEDMFKKKNITRSDLIQPEILPAVPDIIMPSSSKRKEESIDIPKISKASKEATKQDTDLSSIRRKHAMEQVSETERRQTEIAKMEASIRKLSRKRAGSESGSDEEEQRDKKKAKGKGASYLEAEMAKYSTRKVERDKDGKKKRKDESDILAALNSFKGQLKKIAPQKEDENERNDGEGNTEKVVDVDDDRTWLTHELHFPKDDGVETERAERDYEVIDPRSRSARAKEEEAERRRNQRKNRGRR